MKYDDASWHYGGEYPAGLPRKNGATHIGMFLAWNIERALVSRDHEENSAKQLARVRARKMTGADFVMKVCDEKLTDDDLSDEGNRFAVAYFEKKYLADYATVFGDDADSLYAIADTWANYDRLKPVLDRRYEAFAKRGAKPTTKAAAKTRVVAKKKVSAAQPKAKTKTRTKTKTAKKTKIRRRKP